MTYNNILCLSYTTQWKYLQRQDRFNGSVSPTMNTINIITPTGLDMILYIMRIALGGDVDIIDIDAPRKSYSIFYPQLNLYCIFHLLLKVISIGIIIVTTGGPGHKQ